MTRTAMKRSTNKALPFTVLPAATYARPMRLRLARLVLMLPLLGAVEASAQEDWDFALRQKERCSIGTMRDMRRCLEGELRSSEARLNDEYQSLLRSLQNPEPLRQAQRAWLRFRELDCIYATSGIEKDGSLYPDAMTACMIDLDEKRIRDLQRFRSWDGAGAPWRK